MKRRASTTGLPIVRAAIVRAAIVRVAILRAAIVPAIMRAAIVQAAILRAAIVRAAILRAAIVRAIMPAAILRAANRRSAIAPVVMLLAVAAVHAQTQRGGGGESQKIMQQYQQLAAEKSALQVQVAQLKRELESAQTELAGAKKERDALKASSKMSKAAAAQLAQANESKKSAEKSLEQNKQRTEELVDRFKLTIGTLKGVESERTQLQKDYNALNAAMDKCASDNLDLYDISNTVLDRYEHVGLFTRVGTAEPFTRITRTRIDNLVIEYRARAAALRVKNSATP